MATIFAVTFINADGQETVSRFFQTKRAARSWVKWLKSTNFGRNARIMQGGPGGMEVA